MCSIVCRKTIASHGPANASTSARSKRRFGRRVAQPGVLVRLGVGVDADDLGGGPREHVGAVALAAGEVGDPQPADPRGDPLVDGEVAPKPVVLLGDVGQRALAGQRERRHARRAGLAGRSGWSAAVAVQRAAVPRVPPTASPPMPAAPDRDRRADQGRQHPLPRRRRGRVRRQVGDRLRRRSASEQVRGEARARRSAREPRAVRRRARDRRRDRLLHAQPGPARADRAADRDRHLAGDARRRSRRSAAALGVEVETVETEAEELPFADESFDLVFGHAVLHHIPDLDRAFARVPPRAAPGRRRSPSAASRRATATGSPRCRSGSASLAAPPWRRAGRRLGRRRWLSEATPRRPRARVGGRRARLRARRARATSLAGRGLRRRPGPRRGAARQRLRLAAAHARVDRRARPRSRCAWRSFAFRSYLALQRVDTARARAAPAAGSSSTTSCSAPAARSDPASAASDGAAIIAPSCASCS